MLTRQNRQRQERDRPGDAAADPSGDPTGLCGGPTEQTENSAVKGIDRFVPAIEQAFEQALHPVSWPFRMMWQGMSEQERAACRRQPPTTGAVGPYDVEFWQ